MIALQIGHRCGGVHAGMRSCLCYLTMIVLFKCALVGMDGAVLVAVSSEAIARSGIPDIQQQSKKTNL